MSLSVEVYDDKEILEYLTDILKGYVNSLYLTNMQEYKKLKKFIKGKREEKNIEAKKLIDALILKDEVVLGTGLMLKSEEVIEVAEEKDFKDVKEEMLDKFKGVK